METLTAMELNTHEQTVVKIMRVLPPERAAQIVEFARFLKWEVAQKGNGDTLVEETAEDLADDELDESAAEEEILADEARWDQQFAASPEKLRRLAAEALTEIRAGHTTEIIMTDDGRLAPR
jgi:hypothetical protein